MSSFGLESESENRIGESNVDRFMCTPKGSEKDCSLMYPNSVDKSFKLSSSSENSFTLNSSNLDNSIIEIGDTADNSLVEEDAPTIEEQETDAQRIEREERESQELAWQLMQEDNMEMYNMQMQFMQENADQLSEEDRQLMQALVNESSRAVLPATANPTEEAGEEGEEEGDELNDSDSSNWDYERLLQLGQQLGDVKTERWRLRSKSVINSLPRRLYQDIVGIPEPTTSAAASTSAVDSSVFTRCISPELQTKHAIEETENQSSSNKKRCIRAEACACDPETLIATATAAALTATATTAVLHKEVDRCVVCMDDFQCDEELVVFPCKHYFHIPCTEGWLADHNFCPSCKTKVAASPEK